MRARLVLLLSLLIGLIGCTRTVYVIQNPDGSLSEVEPEPEAPTSLAELAEGVRMDVLTSNSFILADDGAAPLYVQVSLEADDFKVAGRAPLNLAIVVDRSGSMSGQKIEDARSAALQLIDQLKDDDRVALVSYSSDVRVDLPSTRLDDGGRDRLRAAIERLQSGGGTHLSGGLEAGAASVRESFDAELLNRVVLLSDGNANEGITDISSLRRISDRIHEDNISITTMGLGLDYNEDIMGVVAHAGGGNYYFVEDTRAMSAIFEQELDTLGNTVIRQAELRLELPEGVKMRKVHGFDSEQVGNEVVVHVNALSAGQRRRVLMEVEVPAHVRGEQVVAAGRLEFRDEIQKSHRSLELPRVVVNITDDHELVASNLNQPVVEKVERVRNAELRREVMVRLDAGDRQGAKAIVSERIEQNRNAAADFAFSDALAGEVEALEELEEEVDAAPAKGSDDYKRMRKANLSDAAEMVVD